MATFRFEAKIIGRSAGRSATASAAYRAAERIDDERSGKCFDYTRKGGVLHTEILAPAGTPEWMYERAQLWNAVERIEKRKDAQLAREVLLSLPHELTPAQRIDLARNFATKEFVAAGMIADISVHAPHRDGDTRNHHAHILLTTRELAGQGFGPKARDWNAPDRLEAWREHWAEAVNQELERRGHTARVDHRSLTDQGLDREPEPKQGPIATEIERQGRASHAGDDRRAAMARNCERAELGKEIAAIDAEVIDLVRERDADPDTAEKKAGRSSTPGTSAGMVAQQREALNRFRRNSKTLEDDRREQQAANDQNDKPGGSPGGGRRRGDLER